VLEAGVAQFTAACFRLEDAPPLGALVAVDNGPIYGVVSDVRTEGRDPGRRLVPHGGPEDDRARVLARNPQIPALLHTVFEATVTGFGEGDALRQRLPPAPPPVYARVRVCTPDEVAAFSRSFACCALLLASGPLADEVTAAYLRRAASVHPNPRAYLVLAGKALTIELAAEADRLAALLRRLRP
jgi:hypothetical protein